jgi:hypothetical protein
MLSKITLALALALAASYVVPASAAGARGIPHAPSSTNPQATAPWSSAGAPRGA